MLAWGLFSLVVVAVPLVALLVWVYREQESSRRRRKFLRRYPQRSVTGIRERVARELATEDTHVIPKVPHGPLPPDRLQEGKFTGVLPLPTRVCRYVQSPTPYPRRLQKGPDTQLMQRILNGLKRLE